MVDSILHFSFFILLKCREHFQLFQFSCRTIKRITGMTIRNHKKPDRNGDIVSEYLVKNLRVKLYIHRFAFDHHPWMIIPVIHQDVKSFSQFPQHQLSF